ncbi:hypothetical protein OK18_00325 [Chryseobacterium gallinarum]|uniref:Uncharacterized protein n=1 Tax=Chryseobacterium gallinarum TaxID=1324352 RepID=A0A0G3LZY6_CHRGL|nr:hypothetical protein [Chryseobacterium gallinarum]AKK71288.1 hypothetical protein OK18_00325 [Chryseobacterium gallinarum]
MKTIYKIFLFISLIGIVQILYSHICGEDGIICVEGMPGCENCDFGGPGNTYDFPKNDQGQFVFPEIDVYGVTSSPIYLPDYWPTLIAPIGGAPVEPTPNQLILQQAKFSDCDGVKRANELAKIQAIRDAIALIKNKNVEWGVPLQLDDPNDGRTPKPGTPYTNNKTNSISFKPTWNSVDGYLIGFIHNHPSGGAPSPSDLFNPAMNIMKMVDNGSIPPSQIQNYLQNFVSIIVSGEYVYTVTIKNALLFSIMAGDFNKAQSAATIQYKNLLTDYFVNNNIGDPPSIADNQKGGEKVLLTLYGKMFNLSKQKISDLDKNQSVQRDSQGNIILKDPCTP